MSSISLAPMRSELERGLALAAPVVKAGLHLEAEVGEAVLRFEIHAVRAHRGSSRPAVLAEGDADVGINAPGHVGASMMAARMFTRFILEVRHHGEEGSPSVRRGRHASRWCWAAGSRRCGSAAASCTSFTAFHSGSHIGCLPRSSMSREQESSRPRRPSLAAR